ncbi:MAG: hypothetical protein ACREKG_10955 [Candidatus Rokuibacteriota bacterium]
MLLPQAASRELCPELSIRGGGQYRGLQPAFKGRRHADAGLSEPLGYSQDYGLERGPIALDRGA